MRVSGLGEHGLIRQIKRLSLPVSSHSLIGIGDDAAVLRISPHALLLASSDMLLEGVHFDLSYTDFYSLGWKSAAVNLSDIAAMGGAPRFCLTSLGIPAAVTAEQIRDFYRGFRALLRIHKTDLVGGDSCSSRAGMVVDVTALGEARRGRVVSRAGARPGDRIYVTGTLGDSAAGMAVLRTGNAGGGSGEKKLIRKHLRPAPRVAEGAALARSGCASAMIDISDGLSSDLARVCEQSGVGAVMAEEKVPLSPALLRAAVRLKKPSFHFALSGGEDYELLFTVPPAKVKQLKSLGISASEIGEITGGRGLFLIDRHGRIKPLRPSGYDHFA
jgi:thiamine-monophosphate kinase